MTSTTSEARSTRPVTRPGGTTAWRGGALEILIAAVAVSVGFVVANSLRHHLPTRLDVATDVIGYNTFHNFDAFAYGQTFYLMTIGWCAASVLVFAVVVRLARLAGAPLPRRGPILPLNRSAVEEFTAGIPDADSRALRSGVGAHANSALRLLAIGAVFGLIYAVVRRLPPSVFARDVVLISIGYALIVGLAAVAVSRLGAPWLRNVSDSVARLNALGACATVVGISLVSDHTSVTTASDGVRHMFHWFPLWLGVGVAGVLAAIVLRALWQSSMDSTATRGIERRSLFLVAVPVVLFLLVAYLPPQMLPIDYGTFETGQRIAPLRFMQLGQFPWRDWVSIHGLFEDGLSESVGYSLIQPSEWGALAGQTLILVPAAYVTLYYFIYRVVGASWALLAAAAILVLQPVLITFDLRFMATPLLLLFLAVSLDRGGRSWPFALGFSLVADAVLVPEAGFVLIACAAALLAHDCYRAAWAACCLRRSFNTTIWCVAGGATGLILLIAVLARAGAVASFVSYYATFIPSHELEGATPLYPMVLPFAYWVLAPAGGILLGVLILGVKIWRRTVLQTIDFVMLAGMLIAVLVYQKFTARADPIHSVEVYGLCIPLLVIEVWQLVSLSEAALARAARKVWRPLARIRLVALAVLAVTTVATIGAWEALPVHATTQFNVKADAEPWSKSVGYASKDDQTKYTDMRVFLGAYLHPGEPIFDFSNEPGLLYYELPYRPAGRYYLIADAILQSVQDDLVRGLSHVRPRFVVIQDSTSFALPGWDYISNTVRHYDVAQFLFDNYRPFANVDGALIYVEKSLTLADPTSVSSRLSQRVTTANIPFQAIACDWGYAPAYLNIAHPPYSAGANVSLHFASSTSWTLSAPPGGSWSGYRWLEITLKGPVRDNHFAMGNAGVPVENRTILFSTLQGGATVYRFPIGACPQWHAYPDTELLLTSSSPAGIASVRVLP
jgi:hypothetical protein